MLWVEMNCKVCGNTSAKNTSVSFFRFPKENSKCRDWAYRCDLSGLFEKHGAVRFHKSFRICSQHFHPKDVVFDGRKNRLLETAIPQMPTFGENPTKTIKNFNFQLPQNLCRLCAEENDNVTDIFGERGMLLDLEAKLKYFPQVIDKHDVLPLKICSECVSKVNHFYDFILNCARAESKLRAMLDTNVCTPSNSQRDGKAAWDLEVETSSNETPKMTDSPNLLTCFPGTLTGNYYNQVLMEGFIGDENGCVLSHSAEESFSADNHFPQKAAEFELYTRNEPAGRCRVLSPAWSFSEESHQCSECGKYFRSKASLRQHRSVHSERRLHGCQQCGKSFKRKDTLCNHLRIHTGERPFMCKVCGFAFKQRGDCIKHEKNHGDGETASRRGLWGQKANAVDFSKREK